MSTAISLTSPLPGLLAGTASFTLDQDFFRLGPRRINALPPWNHSADSSACQSIALKVLLSVFIYFFSSLLTPSRPLSALVKKRPKTVSKIHTNQAPFASLSSQVTNTANAAPLFPRLEYGMNASLSLLALKSLLLLLKSGKSGVTQN
jgi:hypothetical protein